MTADLPIPADHPAFAGHFPDFPLLPGAVLLDLTLESIGAVQSLDLRDWQMTTVKFLEVVRPGDVLTLEHTMIGTDQIRFSVRNAFASVASGVLSAVRPPLVAADDR